MDENYSEDKNKPTMKVQEAIKTIETLGGYKFIQKGRDYYTNQMNYYFRTSKGDVRVFSMGGLRIRAEREQWLAERRAADAELEQGIQLELL